ncbi:MAG: flavin reductase family protein [Anaerolineae bacterium]|nr:flavin reductase family protein [Anaerolineae bacterium]
MLLTTRYRDRSNVMALSWVTPVSLRPPMVAVSVQRGCLSHDYIERSGQFSLSVPGPSQIRQVRDAGLLSGKDVDSKFAEVGLKAIGGDALAVPLVAECLAYLECAVTEAYEVGEDHTLFVAEVVGAQADDGAFGESWLLPAAGRRPLHHLGGHLYSVLSGVTSAAPEEEEG